MGQSIGIIAARSNHTALHYVGHTEYLGSGSQQRPIQQLLQPHNSSCLQQLATPAACFHFSSLSAHSSNQLLQLCTSTFSSVHQHQNSSNQLRCVQFGGYKSTIKNKTTIAVQLIEWQHHINYACQCVNTYTPTANIRILLLSEWLKHLYSKCIV